MNEKPSHDCDSFLEPIELSKQDGDDQVASELLKTVLNEATHVVGAKAGYIRLLQNGKWSTGATTASAAGYMEEFSKLVPTPPLEVGKTMAAPAMVTENRSLWATLPPRIYLASDPQNCRCTWFPWRCCRTIV